jgi:hypothetical protein
MLDMSTDSTKQKLAGCMVSAQSLVIFGSSAYDGTPLLLREVEAAEEATGAGFAKKGDSKTAGLEVEVEQPPKRERVGGWVATDTLLKTGLSVKRGCSKDDES